MSIRNTIGVIMASVPLLFGGCEKTIGKSTAELEKISIKADGTKYLSKKTLDYFAKKYRPIDTLNGVAYKYKPHSNSDVQTESNVSKLFDENAKLVKNAEGNPVIVSTPDPFTKPNPFCETTPARVAEQFTSDEKALEKYTTFNPEIGCNSVYLPNSNSFVVYDNNNKIIGISIGENCFSSKGEYFPTPSQALRK